MLNKTKASYQLHIVNNITEAINFLGRKGNYSNKPKTDIVLLNSDPALNFGKHIIKEINQNTSQLHLPILFLKIEKYEIEITKAIDKRINYTSTSNLDLDYFLETIVSLKNFVSSLGKLPEPET